MTRTHGPLLTDLYQLTMMQGYWRTGMFGRQACFDYFFRCLPFGGGYVITAGLEQVVELLDGLSFEGNEMEYLEGLGTFTSGFLEFLDRLDFTCDVQAVAEGSVVFPAEPVVRVQGPLGECQLVETALLNIMNHQSLIATKAARICSVAGADSVMEFGLRRAHGPDGGLEASRAAYIGGCESTSNVLAGMRYSIPVKGTHAHSWVMAFDNEIEAFRTYARQYPDRTILLVDTHDTLRSGLPGAIRVARELETDGHRLLGVRLDSGDIVELSRKARAMLDEAGLQYVKIVVSGDLDEHRIRDLLDRGAKIDIYGVGTRLATAADHPYLDGVYKLCALKDGDGEWEPKLKRSDSPVKATLPGIKQVLRVQDRDGVFLGDRIELDLEDSHEEDITTGYLVDDDDSLVSLEDASGASSLLEPVMARGKRALPALCLDRIRTHALDQLSKLPRQVRALSDPAPYPVLMGPRLRDLRSRLIQQASSSSVTP